MSRRGLLASAGIAAVARSSHVDAIADPNQKTTEIPVRWTLVAPGVWRARIGKPDDLTPLSAAEARPRAGSLKRLPRAGHPFAGGSITAESAGGRLIVRAPLEPHEAVWGLGLQFMRVNHRGYTRYLRVNSDPRQDTGESHAPVPFYVTSHGRGVLLDTARIATFYCGSTVRAGGPHPPAIRDRGRDADWQATPTSDAVEMVIEGESADLYVFAGPTPLDAVRRYNLFCGGGPLPPRWGLGFWHRADARYTDRQALNDAMEYRKRGYPCDVIGLEPGWQTKSYPCTFEWGKDRFPDPAGFVRKMGENGFRVNLWEHPYVSPDASIYSGLKPLSGNYSVWGGLAPDYSLAEARRILVEQHDRAHIAIGVSGYKLDECDGSELTGASWMFPAHAQFPSGNDGERIRQVYGLLLQRMTDGAFRKRGRRTYGLVRASNAGASALPYVLYSDLYDHRQFVRALCNAGFSGLLWTPEARDASSAEEWVRRMQVVCLSPLAMVNAWATATKPWSFPEVAEHVKKAIELRMSLMPYLYSAFARYHFDGTPPFRAMALEPGAVGADDVGDQYMMGDSLLVAPLFADQKSRDVLLPRGAWYDFETGQKFEGGGKMTISLGLERMPLFARDGAIVPMTPAAQHAPAPGETVPLEIRYFGSAPGRFELYDDDGETFDYEKGRLQWRTIEARTGPDGKLAGTITPPVPGLPSTYGTVRWTAVGIP